MKDKCFVDTSILVYAHDLAAGIKNLKARALLEELWESGDGVVSTQVLQEFCFNVRRRVAQPLPVEEIRRLVQDYSAWEVVTNTPDSVLRALDIEARYKTSFWGALIVQAAESAGASVLYSEDLENGQRYGAIRVVNPLV